MDAPAFDLADYVQVLQVQAPGGEAELLRIAEQLAGRRLDRSRPLWQMWFLTGLPEGRVGWLVKVHTASPASRPSGPSSPGRGDRPGPQASGDRAETAGRKARTRPDVGTLPHRGIAGLVSLELIDRQRVNVCTADLAGPPVPLYLAGARVREVFPLLPLIGKVSLGIGVLSYAGQFDITVVADRATYPDLEVFATGIRDELAALASFAGIP